MKFKDIEKRYPLTSKQFKSEKVFYNNEDISTKLESFLFDKGYSLLQIPNDKNNKVRPYLKYNSSFTGVEKDSLENDFDLVKYGQHLEVLLPIALKHYEYHL